MSDTKYCYPHTYILKNKLGIRDKEKLMDAEIRLTSARMFGLQKKPIQGRFDFNHLCEIHRYIFSDLFGWAGEPRTVDIAKGNYFCPCQNIQSYASDVFRRFYKDCKEAKDDKNKFTHVLAEHYADLNALHPFREGNGRTQREFARELCIDCGYVLDLTNTTHREMLYASQISFNQGDNSKLEEIFRKAITPVDTYKELDTRLRDILLVLSSDDLDKNLIQELHFER